MSNDITSYRPHNPGHDYYDRGIYLITLVVGSRDPLLSTLNFDAKHPDVIMSELGTFLCQQWKKSEQLQAKHGNKIRILAQVAMPDHWHGIIAVDERMTWSLGDIIQAVKAASTSHWRKTNGYVEPPISAQKVRHMSHDNRREYYSHLPRQQRPLFDDDYDDTICLNDEHQRRIVAYVGDNPRRAIYRRLFPHFMQRQLHVIIGGHNYAAFGNLFLLRWARKRQVFCHRKARLHQLTDDERRQHRYIDAASPDLTTCVPYEQTFDYQQQHDTLVTEVLNGGTVIVTPGISKGEQLIKKECLERGFPLIHLQKEPIGSYWKPELSRFNACINGTLLILAPWHLDAIHPSGIVPASTDYNRFHNLNTLAAEICAFEGDARIIRD